jgi:serine/threonine protein kinase
VYRAEQVTVGRDAAIKVLHPQVSGNAELAERFRQEARAASKLNHPHIVTDYNYGAMEDGTLFLAMEYLDGASLHQLIARSGPIAPERAVHIAMQIADSLADAHDHGIVHRDLKPHNVMLVETIARRRACAPGVERLRRDGEVPQEEETKDHGQERMEAHAELGVVAHPQTQALISA